MQHRSSPVRTLAAASLAVAATLAGAHEGHGGIAAAPASAVQAAFDVVHARITTQGNVAVFHMAVAGGEAGARQPAKAGQLAGSPVWSYVWPTTLDPAVVGFAPKSGILAFAVTSHPDFDDTPLFPVPPGAWHSHWVVLQHDDACGKGALKVADIPAGTHPRLPKTWPGLPLLIDSPGWPPTFKGDTLEVRVPFDDIGVVQAASFDGVTAALRVNASVHAPLLCVADVFKVVSGDLTLPGKVDH